jgi:hypothetical protein
MTAEVKGVESMARYKQYDYRQTKMLPVSYEQQILRVLSNTRCRI